MSRGFRRLLLAVASLASLAAASPALGTAQAATGHWQLSTAAAPTNLPPGGEGEIVASVQNRSSNDVAATALAPVRIVDTVPAGLQIVSVRGAASNGTQVRNTSNLEARLECKVEGQIVSCVVPRTIAAYSGAEVAILVKVAAGEGTLTNKLGVEGGGAVPPPATSAEQPVRISSAPTSFGAEAFEMRPEKEDGTLETQAGSHPYQLTTVLNFNQGWEVSPHGNAREATAPEGSRALMRNLHIVTPPGLVGDVNALPQCSKEDFSSIGKGDVNACPDETAIGIARVTINEPNVVGGVVTETVPVFNLEPAKGEPAAFGIEVDKVSIVLGTAVRTGSDYAVEVNVVNATQAASVLQTVVTLWGVPGSPSHDETRGWACIDDGVYQEDVLRRCKPENQQNAPAFLDMPAQCAKVPAAEVSGESWNGQTLHAAYTFPQAFSGCELLGFAPSFELKPETEAASTPTGLDVKVKLPQESTLSAEGLAEADLEKTTIVLPEGVQANPGAANGLGACSASDFGLLPGFPEAAQLENDHFTPAAEKCFEENGRVPSRIGTVRIKTPLLPHELNGSVYLAEQDTTLIEHRLVLYLTAFDPNSGVHVKLAGEVHIDEATGRLISTFSNTPPVPFEELKVNFFGGPNSTQSTPALCGNYASESEFTPSTGGAVAKPSSNFAITAGAEGKACQTSYPQTFAPSVQAGSTNQQAGAFTGFDLSMEHPDSDQPLSGISVRLPEGVAGMLSSVNPCAEPPPGVEWSCGSESFLGEAIESSGLGGSPFTLRGKVYITKGYDGAPFGLLVSTPAVAGPFNLGIVNVRSRINVDPETAAVTITSDPGPHGDALPTMLKGVPVDLKVLSVQVTRPNFQFNPTNCNPLSITTTLSGSQGGTSTSSYPFHATNCGALHFAPKLTASTKGEASRTNGAEFKVIVESAGFGQANIRKVFLTLPKQLPSRLSTIQKACRDTTFNVNPATCPEGSNIGTGVIHTPVLKSPLSGPAYLVSHGNAAFPDVEFVLQGEGIKVVLDGKTDIKNGITYSRFESAPDAPFTKFETVLPMDSHSALGAYVNQGKDYNLCGQSLVMPTEITAQNGLVLKQTTKIAVSGCKGVAGVKYTRAQKLAKALKACHKIKKKKQRQACESTARKKYGAKKKSSKKSKKH